MQLRNRKNYMYDTVDVWSDTPNLPEIESQFDGRHLIHSGTTVLGGVYIPHAEESRSSAPRSVIVDYDENPQVYHQYLDEARVRASKNGRLYPSKLPEAVYRTVRQKMNPLIRREESDPYWRAEWDDIGPGFDNLSGAMIGRRGEPYHMALAWAALHEVLRSRGYVSGRASIETHMRLHKDDASNHSMLTVGRLTLPDGEVRVADPANGYFGTLEDSIRAAKWDYMSLEERERYKAQRHRMLGIIALGDRRGTDESDETISA